METNSKSKLKANTLQDRIDFTQDQKDYIVNNAAMMTAVDLARELFNNYGLTNLSIEARSVQEYLDTLPKNIQANTSDTLVRNHQVLSFKHTPYRK